MSTLLLTHPCFVKHDTGPGHPERPERMRAIDQALERKEFSFLIREEAPLRDDVADAIKLAHPAAYLAAIEEARPSGNDHVRLDADTVMSAGTWEAALRAVGAGLHAVDLVLDPKSGIRNAFAQVRPCGHHAEPARAMGFCVFNNVAIAGLYARKRHGAERVAVVDFDVHHGNGTQDIFWSDKDLYFGSTHQMPLYPGTGAVDETGVGNIFNAPLRPYDGGEAFRAAFESRILPNLDSFAPDIILISAGFDAHEADPLANLMLHEPDFYWATEAIMTIAERRCNGRVVSMLEGGYDLNALARSVAAHVTALMGA
jgi:acetoin utilization deacetylase AcuC-like enzyme